MVARGDPRAALSTFLETLTALQECQYTNKLFPTLYQLAEMYKVLGEVEKSTEISEALSIMQEALNEATKEKKKGRGRGKAQQGDCGSLFLHKAAALEGLAHDLEEKGDIACALHFAESAYRIQQYTLGPRHPETVQTLTNLVAFYAKLGEVVHIANDAEPITFISVIKSSSQQLSTQYTQCTQSFPSHSKSQTISHSDLSSFHWNCGISCTAEEAPSETREGCYLYSPSCLQRDTTTQDVIKYSKPGCEQKECDTDTNGDFPTLNFESFPPSNEYTDLTSLLTFLVIFSVTAIVALSFF